MALSEEPNPFLESGNASLHQTKKLREIPQGSYAGKVVLSKKVTSGQAKELKSIKMTMNLSFLAYYRKTIGKLLPFLLGF